MIEHPYEVIKPLLDRLVAVVTPEQNVHEHVSHFGEVQLALEGLLWDAGYGDIDIPINLWSDILNVDPGFQVYFDRGRVKAGKLVPA